MAFNSKKFENLVWFYWSYTKQINRRGKRAHIRYDYNLITEVLHVQY